MDKTITSNNSIIQNATNDEVIKRLINEGYIAAYFDTAKFNPNDNSTDNIGFISATKIRDSIKNGDDSWRRMVDESIQEDVVKNLMENHGV